MLWTVEAPTQGGTYYERLGWKVRDPRTGMVACSGSERDARLYARAMNRREATERAA